VIFSIRNLSVAYNQRLVLREINLDITKGRLVAIVGPNGAGKSTLIKAALGLVPRLSGSVMAFGKPFSGFDKRIGYVPQREDIDWDFPISVFDVALMGTYGRMRWFQRPSPQEREIALQALESVGLLGYKDRQISQLSGGQQQRTFIARALAQRAELYFMDEPFAGVDAATEAAVIYVLNQLKSEGKTVVAVHHNLETVEHYFDEVVLIKEQLIDTGAVEKVFRPENLERAYEGQLLIRKSAL
jgi:manganese/zinc/iron transport system ATP- binding protein